MRKILGNTIILLTAAFLACVLLTACGDDDDDSKPSVQGEDVRPGDNGQAAGEGMLDLYGFVFRASDVVPLLTLMQTEGGQQKIVTVTNVGGSSLTGTFDPVARQLTINRGSSLSFTFDNFWGGVWGMDTIIRIEDDMIFQEGFPASGDNFPIQGTFFYNSAVNKLSAIIVNDTPNDGVLLKMNDETPIFHTFNQFIDLLHTNNPEWQQKLSLALSIFELLAEQAFFLADTANLIDENAGTFADQGSISFACSTFPPSDFAASQVLTWIDASEDEEVGNGDSFSWVFSRCWDNAVDGFIKDLLSGQIDLNGYVFTTEERDGADLVTRFGFEPEQANTSGVVFTDLVHTEIVEPVPDKFTTVPKRSFTINGGYSILFSEPEQAQ